MVDGTLKPSRIASNIAMLAGGSDAWLVGLMNDYVGFALFRPSRSLPATRRRPSRPR